MAKGETDKPPLATNATIATRKEIEDALFEIISRTLPSYEKKKVVPGWPTLFKGAVHFLKIGQAVIPTLTEKRATELVTLARSDPHAFDAASYLAGMHLAIGHVAAAPDCPLPLRTFGGMVLCGEITRPPQPGRPRSKNVPLRMWQYVLCRFTAERAPLPLTRNRDPSGPASFTACDAVAEAFTRAGRHTTQAQMASLCYDAAHAEIRALAEALNMLDFDRAA